jgi:hypothetical protein
MASTNSENSYVNIRELLGHLVGQTIIDITQHDQEEFQATGIQYVMIMLSGGDYFKAVWSRSVPDGEVIFEHSAPEDGE